jgi:hypothetical protein
MSAAMPASIPMMLEMDPAAAIKAHCCSHPTSASFFGHPGPSSCSRRLRLACCPSGPSSRQYPAQMQVQPKFDWPWQARFGLGANQNWEKRR